MKSEAEILQGCRDGNRKHQQMLYEQMYSKMMVVCLRYAKNEDDALDAFQDAFIKVFNKLDQFDGEGSLEAWIKRIMVNTSIDHLRKQKKHQNIISINEEITGYLIDDEIEEDLLDKVNFNDLLGAIHELSPGYRSVFNMYVVDGFSHQEISEKLGISIGTSKSNLSKAKGNLKNILINKIDALQQK